MGENSLIVVSSIALFFRHGFGAPLGKTQTVAVAVAGDDEIASLHV